MPFGFCLVAFIARFGETFGLPLAGAGKRRNMPNQNVESAGQKA
jgi:hypothetical protein